MRKTNKQQCALYETGFIEVFLISSNSSLPHQLKVSAEEFLCIAANQESRNRGAVTKHKTEVILFVKKNSPAVLTTQVLSGAFLHPHSVVL